MKDTEHPDHTEHIEDEMRQCSSSCLRVGRQCSNIRSNRCTDILTHDQCDTQVQTIWMSRTKYHRDSHNSCRRLNTHGQHTTDKQEHQDGQTAPVLTRINEIKNHRIALQVHIRTRLTQCEQSKKHE